MNLDKKNIIAVILSTLLEGYDFALFGYFASVIGSVFFSLEQPFSVTLAGFTVFASGYLTRPIGGVVFGWLGDTYGRKTTLIFSASLLSLSTLVIGLLPGQAILGITSTIVLVAFRLLQGIAVSGELPGTVAYLYEVTPANQKALVTGLGFCVSALGVALGCTAAVITHLLFDHAAIQAGAWRIPFIVGAIVLGSVALWVRLSISESPEYSNCHEHTISLLSGIYIYRLLLAMGVISSCVSGFYIVFIWWPSFTAVTYHLPSSWTAGQTCLSITLFICIAIISGIIVRHTGPVKLLVISCVAMLIIAYPLFMLSTHSWKIAWLAQMCFAVMIGIASSAIPMMLASLFPVKIRVLAIGIIINLAFAVFAGTAPLICSWLTHISSAKTLPAFYIMALSLLSLVSTLQLSQQEDTKTILQAL